jgi:hypothetical protein
VLTAHEQIGDARASLPPQAAASAISPIVMPRHARGVHL